jgi:hypothetical protein
MDTGNYIDIYEKFHINKHNIAAECLNEQNNNGHNIVRRIIRYRQECWYTWLGNIVK